MHPFRTAATLLLTSAALALSACGEAPAQTAPETTAETTAQGAATSILNAGVMTDLGAEAGDVEDGRIKFLFDPLYDNHFGSLAELTPDLIEAIITGAPPYDGVDAVFVSHAHGDHFSVSMLSRMLSEQPGLVLVAPGQAIERMQGEEGWDESFTARTRAIRLENGEAADSFEVKSATIEAFRSPHGGWPNRHADVHNITYRVSADLPEGQAMRVMHLGDADPASEHFAALEEFLAAKRTGLAMVPFWFYSEGNLADLIDQTLNAEAVVAMHVPVQVPAYLVEGDLPYFSAAGQVLEIPATQ